MYAPVYRVKLIRVGKQSMHDKSVHEPEDAAAIFRDYLDSADRETFVIMGLSVGCRVMGISTVSIGDLAHTFVHPREVFKACILMNAESVIVAHNHPSGDPTPSREDLQVTFRLEDSGRLLGIELRDHIILGDPGFTSMKRVGVLGIGQPNTTTECLPHNAADLVYSYR